ncbi:hypothetical protein GCM10020219_038940 [Nonomuraea dietziae]
MSAHSHQRRLALSGTTYDWDVPPRSWNHDAGVLTVDAAPRTDIFRSPFGWSTAVDASRALTTLRAATGNSRPVCRSASALTGTPPPLLIWADDNTWAQGQL